MRLSSADPTRREVLRDTGMAIAGIAATLPMTSARAQGANAPRGSGLEPVSIGLIADVHQDVIHDAYERLHAFIREMAERKVDAVIQMGDFAVPHRRNQPFMDLWNSFDGPKYHVLGNHDTDSGFSRAQTMTWWDMSERFYSFDLGGWHFVVLDGNDANPGPWQGYHRYIAEDQRAWLGEDLAATDSPTIIFSHQSLESEGGVANSEAVRAVINRANAQAGWRKVHTCLCGHHHTDGLKEIEGVRYIHINSASYRWLGSAYRRPRFPRHIEAAHPYVSYTAPYRDPLYTVLTLDTGSRGMTIDGAATSFIPPTPEEMEHPDAAELTAVITARELAIPGR